MIIESLDRLNVNVELDNGTDAVGNTRTVSVSLGKLSKLNFDNDKALEIVSALGPCLSKYVVSVKKIQTFTLTNNS